MTTTELIKILQDNEQGGVSHRSRKISLTVNGRYLPEPQITLSSTGDGILGPEIDFDVDGEWLEPEADRADEVLDEIRAEIEAEPYISKMEVLEIIDEIIERFKHSAEFERTHGNLMGCQEFKQLAGWLREPKAYKEAEPCDSCCGGDQKEKAKLCQKSYLAGLEHRQESCKDAISREATIKYLNTNMAWYDENGEIADSEEKIKAITDLVNGVPPCTPKQKTEKWIKLKDQKPEEYEDVLVKDIDGEVRCAHMLDESISGISFYEAFSGECIENVVEWREIP